MCARPYVSSQVYTPQMFAVQTITVEQYRTCIAVVSIIMRIGRVPLQNNFVFAIAINVTYACIIRYIRIGFSGRSNPALRTIQRNIQVSCRCIGGQLVTSFGQCRFSTLRNSFYRVNSLCSFFPMIIKASAFTHRFLINFLAVAINIKRNIERIGRQITPAYKNRFSILSKRHYASTQFFTLHFAEVVSRLCKSKPANKQSQSSSY